jgi:hypothetical protein
MFGARAGGESELGPPVAASIDLRPPWCWTLDFPHGPRPYLIQRRSLRTVAMSIAACCLVSGNEFSLLTFSCQAEPLDHGPLLAP